MALTDSWTNFSYCDLVNLAKSGFAPTTKFETASLASAPENRLVNFAASVSYFAPLFRASSTDK
jgi:hypothetical protein